MTCSFQAEDMIVLDLLRKRAPGIPVLFCKYRLSFRGNVHLPRSRWSERVEFEFVNLAAKQSVAGRRKPSGF